MRFSVATLLASTSVALAQYNVSSAPFELTLVSSNATLNGATLSSCHEGAAIESLCVTSYFSPALASQTYNLNTSYYQQTYNTTLGEPGVLAWVLRGSNFNYSESLGFGYNTASNVAHPQFGIGDAVYVAFDSSDLLNVQSYTDDSASPAVVELKAYYRWYACITNYSGYVYQTVNWVLGDAAPQNPTCQKVDVKRVFI